MTNNNEVMLNNQKVNVETGELIKSENVVQETDDYKIVQLEDGTFKKNMKYKRFFSRIAETEEEKIQLYKVFNESDTGLVTQLKNMIGKEITVKHVFTLPYESFNEKTGIVTDGVTTTIEDIDGNYFATSSKSVYHKLFLIMDTFGYPNDENYKPIKVKVIGIRRQNGVQIDLELIGLA